MTQYDTVVVTKKFLMENSMLTLSDPKINPWAPRLAVALAIATPTRQSKQIDRYTRKASKERRLTVLEPYQ